MQIKPDFPNSKTTLAVNKSWLRLQINDNKTPGPVTGLESVVFFVQFIFIYFLTMNFITGL